jgi:hypothetical protein
MLYFNEEITKRLTRYMIAKSFEVCALITETIDKLSVCKIIHLFCKRYPHNSKAVAMGKSSKKAIDSDFHADGHVPWNQVEPRTAA